jgi:hypothetical protein
VALSAGLDAIEERQILPLPRIEPQPFCSWPVTIPNELSKKDSINMDHEEIGCEGVNWIHLALNRDPWLAVVNTAIKCKIL